MCTVTFIAAGNSIFITHNRDEKSVRAKAVPPRAYTVQGQRLLFPRDAQAGGTWISMNENGAAAVLLNGAMEKHVPAPPYRKSRGLAFLDIVAAEDLLYGYHRADLKGIEPFTVIIWNHGSLYECRWNGTEKYIKELDASGAYIWSSVTLYDADTINKRKRWFGSWLLRHPHPRLIDVIHFHRHAGDGDTHNDLCMNRHGTTLTVGITAMEISPGKGTMRYLDLQDNTTTLEKLHFTHIKTLR